MVRQGWSAGTLAIHGPTISGLHRVSSLDPTLCWTRVEDVFFYASVDQVTNSNDMILFYSALAMYTTKVRDRCHPIDGWIWFRMIMMAKWYPGTNGGQILWHLSYWGKALEKTSTGKLIWPGIKPGPAAWEATMLLLDHSSGRFNSTFQQSLNSLSFHEV